MTNNINILKSCRNKSALTQEDVSKLLGIDQGNLARYEAEKRPLTLEILLTYHILFGATLTELLKPLFKKVKSNILRRSQRLIPQLIAMQTPKSKYRIAYLNNVVNDLSKKQEYDE